MAWRSVVVLVVLAAVGMLAAFAALIFVVVLIMTWPESHEQEWGSEPEVSADGLAVLVPVIGACGQHAEAKVEETAATVNITVTVKDDWFVMSCHDAAVVLTAAVDLRQPLGDRELVDGAAD